MRESVAALRDGTASGEVNVSALGLGLSANEVIAATSIVLF
jgi:hypothetical protein